MKNTFFYNMLSHMYLFLHHLHAVVPKQANSASYLLDLAYG